MERLWDSAWCEPELELELEPEPEPKRDRVEVKRGEARRGEGYVRNVLLFLSCRYTVRFAGVLTPHTAMSNPLERKGFREAEQTMS